MKTYKGRGIVLHTLKYGDTSMVAYLLTDVGGRRSYMVQGVRSRSGRGSKLALFQPMFPVEFEGLESPRQQMDRFKEVRAGFVLQSLPFDVRKSTMALFMAEVLYRLVRESEPNRPLFDFVWGSAEALDAMDEGVPNFHLWFLANLSRLLGFRPGNDYTPGAWFDIREGLYSVVRPAHPGVMTQECASLLDRMLSCDVRRLGDVGLNRDRRSEFLNAMLAYFGYHLDAISAVQSVRILKRGVLTLNSKDKREEDYEKDVACGRSARRSARRLGPGAEIRFQARLDPYFGLHASRFAGAHVAVETRLQDDGPGQDQTHGVDDFGGGDPEGEPPLAHHRHRQQYAASGSAFQPLERSGLELESFPRRIPRRTYAFVPHAAVTLCRDSPSL